MFAIVIFELRKNLGVQRAVVPTEYIGLVHDSYFGTHRNIVEQLGNVFWVQTNAAMARSQADAIGFVRAVNEVTRPPQRHHVRAQRIVWPRRDFGGQWIA